MPLPKKIKKSIPLTPQKTLMGRREELLDKINKDGTYLPKSLLHADLDRGFLDFVKEDLKTVVSGKEVPVVDILLTTQNWSQFTETWNFEDLDKNVSPPFITTIRTPEVKYGTNPSLIYNIPNRKQYYYAQVPTWDGQRHGVDVYKIPQPVPVDITYSVKIVCNRMRELNKLNQIVLEKFSSRQAYRNIKGHYIPIVMNNVSDESVMDLEKRKYYIQSYEFTMLGFLIDEDEFEITPAVSRVLNVIETDTQVQRKNRRPEIFEEDTTNLEILFITGNTSVNETFFYDTDLNLLKTKNVDFFDVYINDDFYGSDIEELIINNGDRVKVNVGKINENEESLIIFKNKIK
jgi:hypothetical protein